MSKKVFIVDDSAVVRQVLTTLISQVPGVTVAGTAADPLFAIERMRRDWPDVVVLDIEMPRMDGLTFLRQIMAERPTPVIICSTLTQQGADASVQALAAGAVAAVPKPQFDLRRGPGEAGAEIVQAVRAAASANVRRLSAAPAPPAPKLTADAVLPPPTARGARGHTERVVAIGASTGGTQALEAILTALPAHAPGMLVVQHMPEKFTASFAQRLDGLCAIAVREARHGDRLTPGLALIAPGGRHVALTRVGSAYVVEVLDGPPVSRHKPSVDVLFRSVARAAGPNALGIILTGMGDDGARGLKELHDAGAATIAQNEATCVVYGMPKEAVKLGAADRVLPLGAMAAAILAAA